MKKAIIFILLLLTPFAAEADFTKSKIAVLDFKIQGTGYKTKDMGEIVAEWLITALVKEGRFDVIERRLLKKVLGEQQLGSTGMLEEESVSKLGKLLGVKVIISGSVIRFQDIIEVNARIIDVESASIITAESVKDTTAIGLEKLVRDMAEKIIKDFPLEGYVVHRKGDFVTIDLGKRLGAKLKMQFVVFKEGEIIKHPITGEILDVEHIETGIIEIVDVSIKIAKAIIIREESPNAIEYAQRVKSVTEPVVKKVVQKEPEPVATKVAEKEPVAMKTETIEKAPEAVKTEVTAKEPDTEPMEAAEKEPVAMKTETIETTPEVVKTEAIEKTPVVVKTEMAEKEPEPVTTEAAEKTPEVVKTEAIEKTSEVVKTEVTEKESDTAKKELSEEKKVVASISAEEAEKEPDTEPTETVEKEPDTVTTETVEKEPDTVTTEAAEKEPVAIKTETVEKEPEAVKTEVAEKEPETVATEVAENSPEVVKTEAIEKTPETVDKAVAAKESDTAKKELSEEKAVASISAEKRKPRLFVESKPKDTKVRILNIKPKFQQGIELKKGPYNIEVSAPGYETKTIWISLKTDEDRTIKFRLKKKPQKEAPKVAASSPEAVEDRLAKIREQKALTVASLPPKPAEPRIIARAGRFIKYETGVVKDTKTGLQWIAGPDKNVIWRQAKLWVDELELDGGGWRLPEESELLTIFQKGVGKRNMTPLLITTGWFVWSGNTKKKSSSLLFETWNGRADDNPYRGHRVFGVRFPKE